MALLGRGPLRTVSAFYYAFSIISTLGFGDIAASSEFERVVTTLAMMVCLPCVPAPHLEPRLRHATVKINVILTVSETDCTIHILPPPLPPPQVGCLVFGVILSKIASIVRELLFS